MYNSRSTLGGLVSRLNYATKPNKVGVEVVRALHGVKNTIGGPNKVILVTTSAFTQGAIDFAQSQASSCWDISLKDYQDILSWLSAYQ
ncbi:restriction endonuclease [Vibrio parahaemolyticus]|uniref:restriction endonuclease n=1 Tax=Vibrio parahaemolyticus TaxID=670 RepID=UPI0019D5ECE2|nr:restriction endonuclease [Vibrio parahaemolyticus]